MAENSQWSGTWDEKPWRKFERIVAALHKFRDQGADIRWDEKIAGRQVDVSVRFERGAYQYLILIECKNYADPVPVKEAEAFVTKSRRLQANKTIMVAANGFQSGAKEEAQFHGIALYTLKEIRQEWPQQFLNGEGTEISGVVLWPVEQPYPVILPNTPETAALRFDPVGFPSNVTLNQVVQHDRRLIPSELAEKRPFTIRFPHGCRARGAALLPLAGAPSLSIRALSFNAKAASRPVATRPPDIPLRSYAYENVLTGERTVFGMDLPIGLDNEFRAGAFYRNIMDIAYKCEKTTGDTADMFVFVNQHGRQFGVRCKMSLEFSPRYVEITSAEEIAALEAEYQQWMQADKPDER